MQEVTVQGKQAMRLSYRLNEQGKIFRLIALRGESATQQSPYGEAELRGLRAKLHPLDIAIVAELLSGSVFGILNPRQVGRLLPLLAERTTWYGANILEVRRKPIGVRLRLDGLPNQASLAVLQLSPKPGVMWDLTQGRLLIGSEAFFLREGVAYPVGVRSPEILLAWTEPHFRQLQAEDLEPEGRARLLKDLRQLRIPEEDLASLAIEQGKIVQFVVRLQTDTSPSSHASLQPGVQEAPEPRLQAMLAANYGPGEVLLGQGSGKWQYLSSSSSQEQPLATLLERDNEAERAAIMQLQQLGFVYDGTRSVFVATGDTAIAASELHSRFFPKDWRVERQDGGLHVLSDLRLRTAVQYLPQQSSVDVQVQLELMDGLSEHQQDDAAVAALIELKDLLAWLGTGRNYVQLKDGRYVKPSAEMRRSLLVLADLGLQDGRALVSPLCAGLLRRLGDHSAVQLVDQATQAWLEEISGAAKPATIEPPARLHATLRDYQRRGLDWLMMLHRYRLAGVLADDMGLGKTVQTLSLLLTLQEQEGTKPSLVVVPTSVLGVWQDEIARFAPDLRVVAWYGPPEERRKLQIQQCDVVVTSYGILRRDIDLLSTVAFRYVILDEAQLTKNAHSQTAQVVRQLQSERRLALSGTPLENRPEELWSIFDFLAPGFLGSLRQFRKRYALPMARGEEGPARLLRARLGPLILRRLKQEVAGELPPKTESVLRCVLGGSQRALYDHVAGRLRESVLSKIAQVGIEKAQIDILAALTRLRQICCDPRLLPSPPDAKIPPSAKLALFAELVREALASSRAVLVFSQFVQMQRYLVDVIRHLGVDPLWLHGASKGRDGIVRAFQDPNGPPVIVVSLRAGGLGLTLTRADTVIHYDPWWNPAVEKQATDRAHRLGQDHAVTVYKLICQNTIEERVVALGESKRALAESILTSEGGAQAKLITRDDVLALLG